jgi:hypothetical protein
LALFQLLLALACLALVEVSFRRGALGALLGELGLGSGITGLLAVVVDVGVFGLDLRLGDLMGLFTPVGGGDE